MKTRFLPFLLCWLMSLSLQAQLSKTVTTTTPGTLSTFFTTTEQATVTNLTISGNIDARDMVFVRDKLKVVSVINLSSAKISLYVGTAGTYSGISLVYPANELPMYSFYNANTNTFKTSLTSVTLPTTITSIGYLAFYYCWNITGTFSIPATVRKIGDYALYGCYGITAYSVPSGNTRYSSYDGMLLSKAQDSLFICPTTKAGALSIPSTVNWIGYSALEGCSRLTGPLNLPTNLRKIEEYAFYSCSGLTGDLSLPATLTKLGSYSFYGCSGLNGSVSIQKNLNSIGAYPFLLCNNLTAFNVNMNNTRLASADGVLFSKNLDTLLIFPGAKGGSYTIPASVKVLKDYSFYNCSNLTGSFDIPSNVDSVGNYALFGCSQLSAFTTNSGNARYKAQDGVLYSADIKRIIIYPALATGGFTIPETVERIEASAFAYCAGLTGTIVLPEKLRFIGDYAFYGCEQLTGFEAAPGNIRYAAKDNILYSKAMDSLFICPLSISGSFTAPFTVKYIGYSAFDGCEKITEINLPATVNYIDNYAFENCTGLTKIRLNENVNTIGSSAFYSCTALQRFEFNRMNPPAVDYYTFEGINKSTCNLIIPYYATSNYKAANYWNQFLNVTESNFDDTAVPSTMKRNFSVTTYGGQVKISGFDPGEPIRIYDLNGKLLYNITVNGTSHSFSTTGHGVWLMKARDTLLKIIY